MGAPEAKVGMRAERLVRFYTAACTWCQRNRASCWDLHPAQASVCWGPWLVQRGDVTERVGFFFFLE